MDENQKPQISNIDKYLMENPKILKQFLEENRELINDLKTRFDIFLKADDLYSRYLLCKALFGILTIMRDVSKEKIQDLELLDKEWATPDNQWWN